MQPVARRPVAEHRPEQAKPEPDSAKRLLGLEAAARRSDRLAQAFVAPVRRLSISWRAQLGCERHLCSYRSTRKWLEPLLLPRVKFSNYPRVFSPAFLRNRFRAARDQSPRVRLSRKAQKEARSQTTWTTEPASGQPDEEIRCQPFQLTNFKDSIKRGSRTGKREVMATTRR
jgi:hypothetical protein